MPVDKNKNFSYYWNHPQSRTFRYNAPSLLLYFNTFDLIGRNIGKLPMPLHHYLKGNPGMQAGFAFIGLFLACMAYSNQMAFPKRIAEMFGEEEDIKTYYVGDHKKMADITKENNTVYFYYESVIPTKKTFPDPTATINTAITNSTSVNKWSCCYVDKDGKEHTRSTTRFTAKALNRWLDSTEDLDETHSMDKLLRNSLVDIATHSQCRDRAAILRDLITSIGKSILSGFSIYVALYRVDNNFAKFMAAYGGLANIAAQFSVLNEPNMRSPDAGLTNNVWVAYISSLLISFGFSLSQAAIYYINYDSGLTAIKAFPQLPSTLVPEKQAGAIVAMSIAWFATATFLYGTHRSFFTRLFEMFYRKSDQEQKATRLQSTNHSGDSDASPLLTNIQGGAKNYDAVSVKMGNDESQTDTIQVINKQDVSPPLQPTERFLQPRPIMNASWKIFDTNLSLISVLVSFSPENFIPLLATACVLGMLTSDGGFLCQLTTLGLTKREAVENREHNSRLARWFRPVSPTLPDEMCTSRCLGRQA